MKVELHCHTKYSGDSLQLFTLLYLKCLVCNIRYVAVTDHNCLAGAEQFSSFCRRHGNRVHVIKGEEIFTAEGEIIGLFLGREIQAGLSAQETINQIRKQNGIVYVPHPYDKKRWKTVLRETALAANCDLIDCIECHNGRNIDLSYSEKQNAIADKYHLVKVIGSDAHTTIEIGRNIIELPDCVLTNENFIDVMKKAIFIKKPCIKIAHTITKVNRVLKMIWKGDFSGIYRIIFKRNRQQVS